MDLEVMKLARHLQELSFLLKNLMDVRVFVWPSSKNK